MALIDPVPSAATDVFSRNAQDIDRIVNETANVTTRTGRVMESFPMSTERATDAANSAASSAATASAQAGIATTKANEAAGSSLTAEQAAQTALATGNYAGQWSTLSGAYTAGISVEHNNIFWALRSNTSNIASIQPGVSAEWIAINGANLGTASTKNVATTAQALAGTAGVLPDAAGVKAVVAASDAVLRQDLAKPAGTILRSVIEQGLRDAFVIAIGDSTGVGEDRFVGICARKLAEVYPTHSVELYLWNEVAVAWEATLPAISSGSGIRTIRIYNGSVSGSVATYWTRWSGYLYPGSIDSVIVNYGLNQGGSIQESAALSSIMDLRDRYSNAFDIIPIIQNPDYDLPDRSTARMEAQQRVYRAFGLDPVDSFSLFTDLVNNHGGVTAWLPDKLHPNAAGQEKLAELVFKRLLNSTSAPVFPKSSPTVIPNGNFQRWPNDYVSPLFWNTGRGAVSAYDSGETGRAVKVLGGTGPLSGYISVPLANITQKFAWCHHVYISARLQTTGSGDDVGVLEVVRAEDNEVVRSALYAYGEAGVSSPYRWAVLRLPRDFFRGKAGVELRVLSGLSSQGNSVIVGQVSLGTDPVPCISDGSDSIPLYTALRSILPVSVVANSSSRIQFDGISSAVKGVNVTITAPSLPLGIIVSAWAADTAGSVIVQLSNVTAVAISVPEVLATLTIE